MRHHATDEQCEECQDDPPGSCDRIRVFDVRQYRLNQHRCPIHGACLAQIGVDARGAIVGCTRRDCRFTISEADLPLLRSPEADLAEGLRRAIRHYANEMTRRALRDTRKAAAR